MTEYEANPGSMDAIEERDEEIVRLNHVADLREVAFELLNKQREELDQRIRLVAARARHCIEASGIKLTNPSGDDFDELSQVFQVLVMNASTFESTLKASEECIAELERQLLKHIEAKGSKNGN